jgi:hypothetical protein
MSTETEVFQIDSFVFGKKFSSDRIQRTQQSRRFFINCKNLIEGSLLFVVQQEHNNQNSAKHFVSILIR